eukprot:2185-Heterococcus_DN1.PRE.2
MPSSVRLSAHTACTVHHCAHTLQQDKDGRRRRSSSKHRPTASADTTGELSEAVTSAATSPPDSAQNKAVPVPAAPADNSTTSRTPPLARLRAAAKGMFAGRRRSSSVTSSRRGSKTDAVSGDESATTAAASTAGAAEHLSNSTAAAAAADLHTDTETATNSGTDVPVTNTYSRRNSNTAAAATAAAAGGGTTSGDDSLDEAVTAAAAAAAEHALVDPQTALDMLQRTWEQLAVIEEAGGPGSDGGALSEKSLGDGLRSRAFTEDEDDPFAARVHAVSATTTHVSVHHHYNASAVAQECAAAAEEDPVLAADSTKVLAHHLTQAVPPPGSPLRPTCPPNSPPRGDATTVVSTDIPIAILPVASTTATGAADTAAAVPTATVATAAPTASSTVGSTAAVPTAGVPTDSGAEAFLKKEKPKPRDAVQALFFPSASNTPTHADDNSSVTTAAHMFAISERNSVDKSAIACSTVKCTTQRTSSHRQQCTTASLCDAAVSLSCATANQLHCGVVPGIASSDQLCYQCNVDIAVSLYSSLQQRSQSTLSGTNDTEFALILLQ